MPAGRHIGRVSACVDEQLIPRSSETSQKSLSKPRPACPRSSWSSLQGELPKTPTLGIGRRIDPSLLWQRVSLQLLKPVLPLIGLFAVKLPLFPLEYPRVEFGT